MKIKNKIKYSIQTTNKFDKDLAKMANRGKDIGKLEYIVDKLANKEQLEPRYKNHKLRDDKRYKDCGECHIEPDWILVYKYYKNDLCLLLLETGTHADIFKM